MPRDPRLAPGFRAGLRQATRTLNQDLLTEAIRHAHLIEGFKKGQVKKIAGLLEREMLPRLIRRLEKADGLTVAQQSRIANLVRSFDAISSTASGDLHKLMQRDLTDLAITEAEWQRTVMQRLTPLDVTFNQPSLNVLNQLTLKKGVQGRLLEDWFQDIGVTARKAVEGVLRQGLATGQTVPEMVKALQGTRNNGLKDGAFQAVRRQAATIVRTSTTHVVNQAHEAVFMANQDVVKGVQWVSTLDNRTTDICIALDGQTWPVGQGQRPPAHHQCRSITVPVLESWDKFGVDASKVPEATRRAMTGEVPAKTTYSDWLKTQSPAFQNQVLGKGRAELFRQGVPVTAFVDKALKPKTIAQIINAEGLTGSNLTTLRAAAARRLAASKAQAATRIAQAFGKLPEPVRKTAAVLRDLTAPAVKGVKVAGLPIANAGPILSGKLVALSGASRTTVSRALSVGLAGDWGGFLLSPVAPILAAIPPGSIAVATFGLGNLGQKALRSGASRVANLFRSPEKLAELTARAAQKAKDKAWEAQVLAKQRAIEKAARTRARNLAAQERLRKRQGE